MKPDKLTIGIKYKLCNKCSRGDCSQCYYKDEFERLMGLPNCNDCGRLRHDPRCEFVPKIGEGVRINCPLWEPIKWDKEDKEGKPKNV